MDKKPHDPDEIIAIVDSKDRIIGKATRKEVHGKGLWHREVGIFVINEKGELLLQKRKDNGLYGMSAAGHFSFDEDYITGALRELDEELGVKAKKSELKLLGKRKLIAVIMKINNRFASTYLYTTKRKISEFRIDKGEAQYVKYFNKNALKKLFKEQPIMAPLHKSIKYYVWDYLG
jgi:isopentenyldiphosphate isomerase